MSDPPAGQASSKKQKATSVRQTRAIRRDRGTRPLVQPPDAEVTDWLTALLHSLTLARLGHYHDLGLRQRTLTLPAGHRPPCARNTVPA